MTEVAIRPATNADASAIAALSTQLGYPSTEEAIVVRMGVLEARGTTAVLVAAIAGSVVGWIAVREDLSLESGAFAEIAGLVVDEASRGRRVGESLVAAAENWARERGQTRMRVRSNVIRERAHAFYRRLGYAETKRQTVFDKAI
jgi:GNAT superfamily N-acetyltransferase